LIVLKYAYFWKFISNSGYLVIHEKIVLQIGGMSCINCAKTIEKVLGSREGVYNAVVNFAAENVSVEYNPNKSACQA
jgi:copper chaperone CopZ